MIELLAADTGLSSLRLSFFLLCWAPAKSEYIVLFTVLLSRGELDTFKSQGFQFVFFATNSTHPAWELEGDLPDLQSSVGGWFATVDLILICFEGDWGSLGHK